MYVSPRGEETPQIGAGPSLLAAADPMAYSVPIAPEPNTNALVAAVGVAKGLLLCLGTTSHTYTIAPGEGAQLCYPASSTVRCFVPEPTRHRLVVADAIVKGLHDSSRSEDAVVGSKNPYPKLRASRADSTTGWPSL